MKIAIIDDEPLNRLVLKKIINSKCADKEVIIEDGIVESSISKINGLRPDIILLDIELKNGTGFDVINGLNYSPQIIFTTAYEKYAIQAIKAQAADYILKPINEEELFKALVNCKHKTLTLNQTTQEKDDKNFFSFSVQGKKNIIETNKILYFEGSGAYCYCVTTEQQILISKNIGEIEKSLNKKKFIRCHQSFIVNTKHIIKFEQKRNGTLHLTSGEEIPVSQRKIKAIQAILAV